MFRSFYCSKVQYNNRYIDRYFANCYSSENGICIKNKFDISQEWNILHTFTLYRLHVHKVTRQPTWNTVDQPISNINEFLFSFPLDGHLRKINIHFRYQIVKGKTKSFLTEYWMLLCTANDTVISFVLRVWTNLCNLHSCLRGLSINFVVIQLHVKY